MIWLTMSRFYSAWVRMEKLRVPETASWLMSYNSVPRRTSWEVLYGVHDLISWLGWIIILSVPKCEGLSLLYMELIFSFFPTNKVKLGAKRLKRQLIFVHIVDSSLSSPKAPETVYPSLNVSSEVSFHPRGLRGCELSLQDQ